MDARIAPLSQHALYAIFLPMVCCRLIMLFIPSVLLVDISECHGYGISECHGYGSTRRFFTGFPAGTGTGMRIQTREKPVPVAGNPWYYHILISEITRFELRTFWIKHNVTI
jgi:hypothetical protein